ncbi:MAG: transglycosylase SLT domain-containing protein [Endomicrobium sp.]|jgi:membrane-bound lytic murein transglycosylase D|nr:transglycosylase SLT domain-containing protein [Endomicrobium sp.]
MNIKKLFFLVCLLFLFATSYAQNNNKIVNIEPPTQKIALENSIEQEEALTLKIAVILEKSIANEKTKNKILSAIMSYRESLTAFKEGELEKSKKHFSKFMDKLAKVDIDPSLYIFLFENIDELLAKLKKIYHLNNDIPLQQNYSVPMTAADDSLLKKYITVYSSGKAKERIKAALEKSGAYKEMILRTLREFDLPEELFYLPVVESLYNLNTVSHAGAVGLWQIMPHRGRALGLKINYWIDERRDPEKSTRAACVYLKQLYLMLNDWHLVLAAYNRGEYGLIRDMKFSNASDISEMVSRNAVPKETQNYVPQFIAAVIIGRDLEKYDFINLKYDTPQKYDIYKTDKVIDLKIVAKCANTTVDEIKKLNPALNAWCTPHGYSNFELKIPYGSKDVFIKNIEQVKDLNPAPGFIKHKVLNGEWLEKIAAKYKTTPKQVYKDNRNLSKQKYLHPGQTIIIRPGRKYFA